jgi:hypothetical protein
MASAQPREMKVFARFSQRYSIEMDCLRRGGLCAASISARSSRLRDISAAAAFSRAFARLAVDFH